MPGLPRPARPPLSFTCIISRWLRGVPQTVSLASPPLRRGGAEVGVGDPGDRGSWLAWHSRPMPHQAPSRSRWPLRGFLVFGGFFLPKFGFVVNKLNFHSLHTHHLFWELVKKKEETPSEGAGDEGTRERD